MTLARRVWRSAASRYEPLELCAGLGLLVLGLLSRHMSPEQHGWTFGSVVLFVVFIGALPLVRSHPTAVLLALAALYLLSQREWGFGPSLPMGLIVAVFAMAAAGRAPRGVRFVLAGLAAVAVDLGAVLAGDSWNDSRYIVMSSWVIGAAAVGTAVRNRQAYLHEMRDRAVAAEQSREHLAERRVAEERLRIARDVHDLVAHHIAVINVQAGVAGHLLQRQPEAASEALAVVRGAASSALQELGGLIGVLRQTGDAPSLAPSPTVADMPRLLRSFEAAGLTVEVSQQGVERVLPPTVDLTAFRLIQESLTNAHKHGRGEAALLLAYETHELVIDVVNPTAPELRPRAEESSGCGNGLLGMRERVGAVGGTLRAGRTPEGRFQVHARLPIGHGSTAQGAGGFG